MERKRRVRAIWGLAGALLAVAAIVVPLLVLAGSGQATLTAETYADVIRFGVQGAGTLQIQIYDLSEKVLWDSGAISSDFVDWNRTDTWGERLANGYYLYLAQAWDMSGSLILSKTGKVALLPGDQVQLQAAPAVQNPGATSGTVNNAEPAVRPMGLGDTGVFKEVGIGTGTLTFARLSLSDGSAPEASAAGLPWANTIGVYGDGKAYFMGRDVTNNIEYAMGVSILGGAFIGTMTAHDLWFRTDNVSRVTIKKTTGNVGIGTTSPATRLDVYGTTLMHGAADGIVNIGSSSGYHLTFDADDIQAKNGTGGEEDLFLNYFGGNVAVGGILPTYRLDVEGDRIRLNSPTDARELMLRVDGAANDLQAEAADLYIRSNGGYDIHMNPYNTDGAVIVGATDKTGTVLFVSNNDSAVGAETVRINNADGGSFGDLLSGYNGADREFFFDYMGDLYLDGTTRTPADFAELMKVEGSAGDFEPGDVLVVLPTGRLALSSAPYSTSLVGVYSTKPGVLGDYTSMEMAEGESEAVTEARKTAEGPRVPVALLGIVPVKACAENGAIRPGDVLTTSSTPGHAMKASPVLVGGVQIYPTGAILGKALEPLEAGTGIILALITLR